MTEDAKPATPDPLVEVSPPPLPEPAAKPTAPVLTAELLQATAALGHAVDPTNGPIMHCSKCKENAGDIVTLNLACPPKDREAITAPPGASSLYEKLRALGHTMIQPDGEKSYCGVCSEEPDDIVARDLKCGDAAPPAVPAPKDLRPTAPVLGRGDQLTLERKFRERERSRLVLENTALKLGLARVEVDRTTTELRAEIMRLGIDAELDFDVDDEGKVTYVENEDDGNPDGSQRKNGGRPAQDS